jgi:hypothetical protein
MVRTTDNGPFAGNALRFATKEEAQMWLDDLMCRWFAVTGTSVVESADPVNYSTVDGRTLVEVK